jgi:HEAT repeat protein
MPERHSLWAAVALCALGLAAAPAPTARAQEEVPRPERPEEARLRELKKRVLDDGAAQGEQAAFDLFTTGRLQGVDLGPEGAHDTFLRGVVQNREGKREARLCILRALRACGRFRVEAACRLVQDALDDPVTQVAQLAIATFPTLDDERGATYRYIQQQLNGELRRVRPGGSRQRQALGLIEVLERMPNPIDAVGVLVAALSEGPRTPSVEARLREALQRMTAQPLEAAGDWRKWYDEAKNRSLAEWRLEVARQRDARLRRYESEAERYFGKMLASLQADKDALMRELQSALTDADTVFAVRRAAIRELGTLGKRGEERAVNLLRARLAQQGGGAIEYDETKALVIEALGETGKRELLRDIEPFLGGTFHVRMRMAAAGAIGALEARDGVDPLLGVLSETTSPSPPPDDLLEVVVDALGRVKANPDGRVSAALLEFLRMLRGHANGSGPAASASLLATLAKSLGGLNYARDGAEAGTVTARLEELAGNEDMNVRFFATTALGVVSHPQAFTALVTRLTGPAPETAVHVRKAILDAIGQQALDRPDLSEQAIRLLAPFLDDAEDALRRKARQRLEELATRPPGFRENFAGLAMVVDVLMNPDPKRGFNKPASAAVPFLTGENGLPPPEALNQAQLAPPLRDRYYELLAVRARGQLDTDPQAAYADFDAVVRGLDLTAPSTPKARGLHLGKARALLRMAPPRPKDALALLTGCLASEDVPEQRAEVWTLTLEAIEKLKQVDPAAMASAVALLQPHLSQAPADVQRKVTELVGTPR